MNIEIPHKIGSNYLLVIAIDKYNEAPRLFNAVRDATYFIEILTNIYTFEKENIYQLFNSEASKKNIFNALNLLLDKITPIDNLVIFFSGHGSYNDKLDEGYWLPIEAKFGENFNYIPNRQLLTYIKNIDSKHTILFIDSCFSGSLFALERNWASNKIESYPSRWALTSGRLEPVLDGKPGGHSPFAENLMAILRHNPSDSISIMELIERVTIAVTSNSKQTPRGGRLYDVGGRGGIFFFHKKNLEAIPLWEKEWSDIKNDSSLLDLIRYVQSHPNSKYGKDAIEKISQFEKFEANQLKKIRESIVPEFAWSLTMSLNSISAFLTFLISFPNSKFSNLIKQRINKLYNDWLNSSLLDPKHSKATSFEVLKDHRDGHLYKTININGICWMAENLRFEVSNSFCYSHDINSCIELGRLYTLEAAKMACPEGWRLPNLQDWLELANLFGGYAFFENYQWHENGTNPILAFKSLTINKEPGFYASFGGYRGFNNTFSQIGQQGFYWSLDDERNGKSIRFDSDAQKIYLSVGNDNKNYAYSVRCIKK